MKGYFNLILDRRLSFYRCYVFIYINSVFIHYIFLQQISLGT